MNIKGDDTLDNLYTKKLKHFHNNVDIIIPKLNVKIEELENKKNSENKDEINQQINKKRIINPCLLNLIKANDSKNIWNWFKKYQ